MAADFDLNLLPIAVALYDQRSVSRAAEKLGMSQPAVSAALAKLRKAIGDPLFVRTSRGMEPTPRAQTLVGPAREALLQIDEKVLSDTSFDPLSTRRTFKLSMSDFGEIVFLPRLMEVMAELAPNVSLQSRSLSASQSATALENGEIDLAVGYIPDLKHGNYYQQRLFTNSFACLVRAGHPVTKEPLTLEMYQTLKHAAVVTQGRHHEVFESFLEKRGIHRDVVLYTAHFTGMPRIICHSDLVVTIPQAVAVNCARITPGIRVVEPAFEMPEMDVKQHWHRRFHKDPRSKWLRGVLLQIFEQGLDKV